MSISFATNGVSVNNQAAYRKGEYFRAELPEDNTSAARWLALTNLAVLNNGTNADIVATSVGHQFLPQTPEHYTYDADGNLTQDGHWNYTWDAENRLVKLSPSTTLGPQISLAFEHDWQGRRIHKQVWANTGWSGTPTNDVKFVYDGWNLIGILNSSFTLQTSFVWGSDLFGSIQGAGGVGGLLFICDLPSAIGYAAPAYDGNGNVMALVSMSGGTNCAAYEYGPFGEVIRATGPMAKANPFRFSTKYQDDETDLLYYGYRYLNASSGRWLIRDPAEEDVGPNLYCFVQNNAQSGVDGLGLCDEFCGNDVTSPVNNVLDQVNSKFAGWSSGDQRKACRHLISAEQGAGSSWDILEMRQLGADRLSGCARQATFKGRCYFGSAINYAMFGRAICNCHNAFPYQPKYFLDSAIAGVIYHKIHTRGGFWGNEEAMQAVAFTKYGWSYSSSTDHGVPWYHFTCAPDATPDRRVFGWHWLPLKPKWYE
jgi:RHS repeat-associated protein